jgi:NitT/TauT family transport system substrate-binding protein
MNKKLILCVLLMLPLILLVSCKVEPRAEMRIGTNIWPGYEPIWLAHGMNYFGTDLIQPVPFLSTTDASSAFRNRMINAAALTLDEALALAQFDSDFSIILVVDISDGADVVLGKPGMRSMKDIRGKRIGVETTAVGAYTLTRALQLAGLRYEDVKVVNINVDGHEEAFKQGTIDAVVTFEPVRTRLLATGARLLFDSSRIPDEIFDIIIVRNDFLQKHPDLVRQFIDGWFNALAYMREHPSDAAEKMKVRMKLSAAEVIASYKGLKLPERGMNKKLLSGDRPLLLDSAQKLENIMIDRHLLYKRIEHAKLVDRKSIEKLYKE